MIGSSASQRLPDAGAVDATRYLDMERAAYAELVARSDFATDAFTHVDTAEFVVGSYAQHEAFDYERWLLGGVDVDREALALDYGCGPGRMLLRLAPCFRRVDGVDISPEVLDVARRRCAHLPRAPRLFASSGQDLSPELEGVYDVAFSVICLQHICVYSIRKRILESLYRALKPGGLLTFQMGYGPGHAGMVDYFDDFIDAPDTNGAADVGVLHPGEITGDLADIGFTAVSYCITPTGPGDTHGAWIFVRGFKPGPAMDRPVPELASWIRCETPSASDAATVDRARRLHREHGLLASRRAAVERITDLESELGAARRTIGTLEAEREQLAGRVEIDERQLLRLRAADAPRVRGLIADLVQSARADSRRVGVFGAGAHTAWLLRETDLGTLPSLFVFDSNPAQSGRFVAEKPVRPFTDIAAMDLAVVVVSSLAFQDEMTGRLESLRLPGMRIVRCYP